MGQSDCKMAHQSLKEESRSASLKNGELCVMISGGIMKHWLYAGNWDLLQVVSYLTVSNPIGIATS